MATEHNDRTFVERTDPVVGSVFDRRYRVEFRLAAGGFGAIYRATHIKSGHQFALKLLHPQLASDPGVVARFRREGQALTTLRSPHTVTAYELGEAEDGTLYIVMELLAGESLYERFRAQGRLEWKRVAKIARQICTSLAEAHARGIIHRDLKPTNIQLEPRDGDPDFVKVLDFGIAKLVNPTDADAGELTNAGQMIGTLDYMAPEQMVGGVLTGQCDIYVLGLVMYEMIAGKRAFDEAATPSQALAAILRTTPRPLSRRAPVPAELEAIVMRCLEREATARWPDVVELGRALDRLLAVSAASVERDDEVTRAVDVENDAGTAEVTTDAEVEESTQVANVRARPAAPPGGPGAPGRVLTASSADPTPAPTAAPQPHSSSESMPPPFSPAPAPAPGPHPLGRLHTPPGMPAAGPPMHANVPVAAPYRVAPAPQERDGRPAPMPYPPAPYAVPPPAPPYAHNELAARDATIRRLVWVIVLLAGALVGVLVATQA